MPDDLTAEDIIRLGRDNALHIQDALTGFPETLIRVNDGVLTMGHGRAAEMDRFTMEVDPIDPDSLRPVRRPADDMALTLFPVARWIEGP